MNDGISLKNLEFSYKNQKVFENLNENISSNQFIAVVGANGSGKSTLIKLIMGLLKPKTGSIEVLGFTPGNFELKQKMGSTLQDIGFPDSERVEEILEFVSDQYSESHKIEELIETFTLSEFRKKSCGQLSGGMKRRLSLACTFMGKPQIILLDEPTTGLDHNSRAQLMTNLKKYQKEQKALILMISHYPDEVINYVDQFFHIKNSNINKITPTEMKQLTRLKKISFDSNHEIQGDTVYSLKKSGTHYKIIIEDSDAFVKNLYSQGFSISNLFIEKLEAQELIEEIL